MFGSDYPRAVVNCLWRWWFPAFDALPVASALPVPFLLAGPRLPVSLLGFPARPSPRRFPALGAAIPAIPLARLSRMQTLFASFQQTQACPRPAHSPPPLATSLLPGRLGTIFGRAHGR